jgi:hypothetical protein
VPRVLYGATRTFCEQSWIPDDIVEPKEGFNATSNDDEMPCLLWIRDPSTAFRRPFVASSDG